MNPNSTVPISPPPPIGSLNASQAQFGAVMQPVRRLQAMEDGEWEEFVLEWADSLRADNTYTDVHRCGGGGDMGRDIVAFTAGINQSSPCALHLRQSISKKKF